VLESVWNDLRYGARMLAKTPGVTCIAVLSIALGIGVNAAMFSMADGLALRPLQVPDADGVVAVTGSTDQERDAVFGSDSGISYPDYLDLRDRSRTFTGLVAYDDLFVSLADRADEPPRGAFGLAVSGNFFDVLRLTPALGRTFVPGDDRMPARDAVVVLAHDTWTSRFGADPHIVGHHLRLGGVDVAVIGVAPSDFPGMDLVLHPAFYIPLGLLPSLTGLHVEWLDHRDARALSVRGRLQPGTSLQQAQADVQRIARGLQQAYPDTNRRVGFRVKTGLEERRESQGPSTPAAWTLVALAGVVLLVACANVAGLLMSRAAARMREISVRIAIGGSRLRIARQLFTESALIAALGAGLGLVLAYAVIRLLGRVEIVSDVGISMRFAFDRRVLGVALLATVASTLLAGVMPAWQTARAGDLAGALKIGTVSDTRRSRLTARNMLVTAQVALALTVLTIGVFMYRTFETAFGRPGFRTDHILLVNLDPTLAGYDTARGASFYRLLKARVQALPGVQSVAMTSVMPLNQDHKERSAIVPEGYQFAPGTDSARVSSSRVDSGYFATLGIPIVSGRGFRTADTIDAPLVAIINQTMAARYWPGADPIGKRLRLTGGNWIDQPGRWLQIVGVVADGKYNWVGEAPTPFLYLSEQQMPSGRATVLVRSDDDSATLAASVRRAVRELDANMPVTSARTVEEWYYGSAVSAITGFVWMIGGMGLLGVMLALVGLYGLVSYAARRRTREIAIRMAVGATPASVLRIVLGYGLALALTGTVIGLAASVAAGQLLRSLLPSSRGVDAATFALVVPALVVVTMVAAYLPARRAARIDPLATLRAE
jgi:predicted permease